VRASTGLPASPEGVALEAKLFRGLGDPSRLALLRALGDGERSVSELVEATGLSQSNASTHLACLRECGLVRSESRGRFVMYRLSDARIPDILRLAGNVLADSARGVFECTRYCADEAPPAKASRRPKHG
jgi:ArsR family transcriptional regulator, cadmium/lead-responsive transcriptional repressor